MRPFPDAAAEQYSLVEVAWRTSAYDKGAARYATLRHYALADESHTICGLRIGWPPVLSAERECSVCAKLRSRHYT